MEVRGWLWAESKRSSCNEADTERQPGPQDEKDLVPQETRGAEKQPERLGKKEQGPRAGARGTASAFSGNQAGPGNGSRARHISGKAS